MRFLRSLASLVILAILNLFSRNLRTLDRRSFNGLTVFSIFSHCIGNLTLELSEGILSHLFFEEIISNNLLDYG